MFDHYWQPQIKKKKFGLFDEESVGTVKPTGMLNDAETSAYISAKYPMKSEFNEDWARSLENRREDNPMTTLFPVIQPVPIHPNEDPSIKYGQTAPQNIPFPVAPDQTAATPTIENTGKAAISGIYPRTQNEPQIETLGGIGEMPTLFPVNNQMSTIEDEPRLLFGEIKQPGFGQQVLNNVLQNLPNNAENTVPSPTPQSLPENSKQTVPYPVIENTTPGFNPNEPNPLTAMPNRRAAAQARINEIKNKDYSLKKNQPLLNEKGETVGTYDQRGKDRDTNKNWWDSVKSAGIGALVGFLQGGFGGALGGAVTGGVMGAIDRNADEKMIDRFFKLPAAEQELIKAQAADELDSKLQTAAVSRQNVVDDNIRSAEQFSIKEQNRFLLDQRKSERRVKELEERSKREGWTLYTDEQGRRWRTNRITGNQEPIIDPDTNEQDIDPNYKTYQVFSPSTRTMVTIRGRDLYNAEMQTERTNTTIANQESDDETKYKNDFGKYETEQKEFDSKISANQQKVNGLIEITNGLIERKNGLDTNTREGFAEASKLQSEISKNQQEIKNIEAENTKLAGDKKAQKPPVKPAPKQRLATPQTVGTYSESQFRKIMQGDGKTPDQINLLVERAKAQGIIK